MNNEGEVYASRTMPIHSMDCVYDQDVEMKDAKGNDIIRHMFVISINGDQLGEDAL